MKSRTIYICEKCGREWDRKPQAMECEAAPVPPKPCSVGGKIRIRNDAFLGDEYTDTYSTAIVSSLEVRGECLAEPGRHVWFITIDGSIPDSTGFNWCGFPAEFLVPEVEASTMTSRNMVRR